MRAAVVVMLPLLVKACYSRQDLPQCSHMHDESTAFSQLHPGDIGGQSPGLEVLGKAFQPFFEDVWLTKMLCDDAPSCMSFMALKLASKRCLIRASGPTGLHERLDQGVVVDAITRNDKVDAFFDADALQS